MSAVDYKYRGDLDAEGEEVAWKMTLFHQVRTRRVNFESQWEEAAALVWPDYMSSFTYGRDQSPGIKRTQYQLSAKAPVLVQRFSSIIDWLITPSNMMWSKITVTDKSLMKRQEVKDWCAEVSQILWCQRYKAQANFMAENSTNMRSMAVFGNMGMYIDEIDDWLEPGDRGLRYLGLPIGELYIILDHQRRVVGFIRHFRLNAQQAVTQWKENAQLVPQIKAALEIGSQTLFDFLHFVLPNTHYNPFLRLSKAHQKYESTYISAQGYCILAKGGFRTLPLAYAGYIRAPDEDYWRGPTQMALATHKSKNAIKRVFLKQGHRAADPAYLVGDTGLVDLKTHPGGWNSTRFVDGKPQVQLLPTGEVQYTEKMMEMDDAELEAVYLVDLFKHILENPGEMNPRQVVEYVNERGVILFPTVGGVSSGYLGPLTDRELDVLSWNRLLPPMPQVLREARGEYEMEYTNPISLAMRGQKQASFMRLTESLGEAIKSGADPSIIDILDFDAASPEIAEDSMIPNSWITGAKKLAAIRKSRQQAQERENQVKELPGRAAIMKAKAISDKAQAGQNIGGTLSGTPQGGMPLMPGQ